MGFFDRLFRKSAPREHREYPGTDSNLKPPVIKERRRESVRSGHSARPTTSSRLSSDADNTLLQSMVYNSAMASNNSSSHRHSSEHNCDYSSSSSNFDHGPSMDPGIGSDSGGSCGGGD